MTFGDLELHDPLSHVVLGVNQSAPEVSSTSNQFFYKALGQLHGVGYHLELRIAITFY